MVEKPSRNSAIVSLTPRPCRRSTAVKMTRADRPGHEGEREDGEGVQRRRQGSANGKNTFGNTTTEAMAKTKKSKYSAARPMMTPMAISLGGDLVVGGHQASVALQRRGGGQRTFNVIDRHRSDLLLHGYVIWT